MDRGGIDCQIRMDEGTSHPYGVTRDKKRHFLLFDTDNGILQRMGRNVTLFCPAQHPSIRGFSLFYHNI